MSESVNDLLVLIPEKVISGNRSTTAANVREVLSDIVQSYLNLNDGGLVVNALSGYSVVLTPTDPKHFATKKYVDDANPFGAGTAGQTFQYQSGVWVKTTTLQDASGKASIDLVSRTLKNGSTPNGGVILSWADFTTFDSNGILSIDWSGRAIYDNNATHSIDYNARLLHDSIGQISANYDTKVLYDSSGNNSVAWGARIFRDSSNHVTIDYDNRLLSDSSETVIFNWSTGNLHDSSARRVISLNDYVLVDAIGFNSLSWQDRQFTDGAGFVSLNYNTRVACDSSLVDSLNWQNRQAYNIAGTMTVDWSGSNAALEVVSNTQGFLPPRMSTIEKNAIGSPSEGSILYDTTLKKLCVYTTAWETITSL